MYGYLAQTDACFSLPLCVFNLNGFGPFIHGFNQLILYHVRLNSPPGLLESMILEVIKTPQSRF